MLKKAVRVVALGAATVAFAASAQAAAPASASGQGTLDGGARHFSFNARELADGTVTGHATLTNKNFTGANGTSPYKLQIDITCMNRIGNDVYFGGTTKRTNDPNLVDAVFFAVRDNGEPGKGVDQISRAFFWDDDPNTTGDPQACELTGPNDFPLETIEAGNIQVRS